jgi:stearoyl-CoA desaturase (delta-9 desaturase)
LGGFQDSTQEVKVDVPPFGHVVGSHAVEGFVLLPLLVSLATAVVLTQVATFSTTIYLHRCRTHHALSLHPTIAWLFRFALWITTGLSTKEWVAVHRKHHAFTDEDGDPHSPRLKGFWPVQLGNVFFYVRETRNVETIEKYARDIKVDRWDRWLFNRGLVGPAVGTVALCTLIGVGWGLLAAGLHAVTYVFFLSSSINGLCHSHGYRTFDNTATNIRWLALLTGGEGLHNNHHGFPRSPKFSLRTGEIDPSWPIIQLLTRMKLAHPCRTIEAKEIGFSPIPVRPN